MRYIKLKIDGATKIKRAFDLLVSILLLVILSPIIFLSFIVSGIETRGFPIFMQLRGLSIDHPLFKIYKVRTISKSLTPGKGNGKRFLISPGLKEEVPTICGLLRKFGVDELPQLINVIKGEMSLVGPRPLDLFDLKILKNDFPLKNFERYKLNTKPGIIGLWQINGKRSLGAGNLLYWDKLYNQKQSMRFDLQIIFGGLTALASRQKEDSIFSAAAS